MNAPFFRFRLAMLAGLLGAVLPAAAAGASVGASALLPSGRALTPVGALARTDNFPVRVLPLGDSLAVLDSGAGRVQHIELFAQAPELRRVARFDAFAQARPASPGATIAQGRRAAASGQGADGIERQSLFQGMAASADAGTLFVAGGDSDDLLALRHVGGQLRLQRRYPLRWQAFPSSEYPYQYAGNWQQSRHFYPDGVALGPAGRHAYVTGMLSNSLARIDLASGEVRYLRVGSYPYGVVLADSGRRLVVSNWGGNGVTVVDPKAWKVLGSIATGPALSPRSSAAGVHPTAMVAEPGSARVWVADTNVDRIVAIDTRSLRALRVIDDSPFAGAAPGSMPDALAIAGSRLFVANAGDNDVAVYQLPGGKRVALIPTGWSPAGLAVHDGMLDIVSSKGLGSGPNLQRQWVGSFMHGLLQRVPLSAVDVHAAQWTAQALADAGMAPAQRARLQRANRLATRWLHAHIRHVVFILRENKTFDEELGRYAAAGAKADPKLALYGPRQLPNLFALARGGALFTDFYADGEVTSQGHQWTTAGADSDFIERTWPLYYSNRGYVANSGWTQSLAPDARDAHDPFAIYTDLSQLAHWSNPWVGYPSRRFLFDQLLAHGVSFEDFGEFASRDRSGSIAPRMRAHMAVDYPAWDRQVFDTGRARLFEHWLQAHALPTVTYLWLPDDHTAGSAPCMPSPDTYVADNDQATARVIRALSRTPQWSSTLVLLTEDDAQSGADHVDAHRTFALAYGPWVAPGRLVGSHLSQVDLLRTIEAVAGVPPMSQWDQGARVLDGIWRTHADLERFELRPLRQRALRNPGTCKPGSPFRDLPVAAAGAHLALRVDQRFGTTTLLKVDGPEQMRQIWLASRGPQAYARMLAHVRQLGRDEHRPLASLMSAGDDD